MGDDLIHVEFLQGFLALYVGTVEDMVLCPALLKQPLTVTLHSLLEGGHHLTGIAEVLRATLVHLLEELLQMLVGIGIEGIAFLRRLTTEDAGELVGGIVGKLQTTVETGGKTGVGIEEVKHLLGVASDDTDELAAQFLDRLQQGVDGLAPVVTALTGGEGVGLVDEEHTAHGGIDHLTGLRCRATHELCHKILTGDLDELTAGQDAQGTEHVGEDTGHGSLSRAGIAEEHVLVAERRQGLRIVLLDAVLFDILHDAVHLVLHVVDTDESVETAQDLVRRLLHEDYRRAPPA